MRSRWAWFAYFRSTRCCLCAPSGKANALVFFLHCVLSTAFGRLRLLVHVNAEAARLYFQKTTIAAAMSFRGLCVQLNNCCEYCWAALFFVGRGILFEFLAHHTCARLWDLGVNRMTERSRRTMAAGRSSWSDRSDTDGASVGLSAHQCKALGCGCLAILSLGATRVLGLCAQ